MRAYVGVTDGEWYRFLADRPDLDEVNFWRPGGGRAFHVLTVGEPFFFKTHHPHNRVVGGGFYSGYALDEFGLPTGDRAELMERYEAMVVLHTAKGLGRLRAYHPGVRPTH